MATATTFDASKLVVGKKYPTRDGRKVEFMRAFTGMLHDQKLLFMLTFDDGTQTPIETFADGRRQKTGACESDVISDEPIREPVEVKINTRFLVVYSDGTTGLSFCTATEAVKCSSRLQRATGIYELPNTLTVTPVNP